MNRFVCLYVLYVCMSVCLSHFFLNSTISFISDKIHILQIYRIKYNSDADPDPVRSGFIWVRGESGYGSGSRGIK